MRNFTREGAAVPGEHTQRSEYPYPGAPRRRAAAQFPGRLYPDGAVPGGVTQPAGRGLPPDGTGRDRRLPHSAAATGRTSARLPVYPGGWRRYTGRRLPGQTERFVGQTRRVSGRPPGAAAVPGRRLPCAGAYAGRGYPIAGGRTGYHGGGTARRHPTAKISAWRLVTGLRRFGSPHPDPRFGFSPWVVCRHPVKEHIWHIHRSNVIG